MIAEPTIKAVNEAFARIPLSERRVAELPVELDQFASVAELVRPLLAFDVEPASFLAALEAWAWKE